VKRARNASLFMCALRLITFAQLLPIRRRQAAKLLQLLLQLAPAKERRIKFTSTAA
jgi:hypothetical protein